MTRIRVLQILCGLLLAPASVWAQATNVFPASGNVGIGTTTPAYALDVVGDGHFTRNIYFNGYLAQYAYGSNINSAFFLSANGTQAAPTAIAAGGTVFNLGSYGYDGSGYGGGVAIVATASQAFTPTAHGTNLNFFTTPTNGSYYSSYPARMTITGNGAVGVGTTTPGYQLDVQGGQINSSGGYCINGTNCITAWPTGGGGSGTVTSITAGSGLSGGTITTSGTLSLNLANANAWTGAQSFGANTNFPGGIWNSAGGVGIGTTTPAAALHVDSTTVSASYQNSGGSLYRGLQTLDSRSRIILGAVTAAPSPSLHPDITLAGSTLFNETGMRIGYNIDSNVSFIDTVGNWFAIRGGTPSNPNGGGTPRFFLDLNTGNVGIGTTSPQHPLHVAGAIGAEEVIVSSTGADYVFDRDYHLAPLSEIAAYIKDHHHLPDVPSATEMQQGIGVGEMQAKLLSKIEELTLHMIEAEERNTRLEQENRDLLKRIARLESNENKSADHQGQ